VEDLVSRNDPDDPDNDAKKLAELGRDLPPIDVDATTGEQIARRARMDVGKGLPRRRWILPIAALAVSLGYLTWTLLKVFEVLG
jgi:hypothetical protein